MMPSERGPWRRVLRAEVERLTRRGVHFWLVLECHAPDGAHHAEQRYRSIQRGKLVAHWKAPERVRCSECR